MMKEKESKTFTIGGKEYAVSITMLNYDKVAILVNGESKIVALHDSWRIGDVSIVVEELIYKDCDIPGIVQFYFNRF